MVAVIIVNYRTPDLTIAAGESVLASTGVSPTLVIVDNASGAGNVARLRAHFSDNRSVTVVARPRNEGFTGGNNAGVAVARSQGAQYAFLLNSDATVDHNCLNALLVEAERDDAIALAVPRIFFAEPDDRLWFGGGDFSLWRGRAIHIGFRDSASRGWTTTRDARFASGCAVLVRLDALGAQPLFDASLFAYAEDLDLSLRLRGAGFRIRYVPAALAWHMDGASHTAPNGSTLRFYLATRNALRVLARHARWYHWLALAPTLAIDLVGRYCVATLRRGDWRACVGVMRGVMHAFTGGRHAVEIDCVDHEVLTSARRQT